MNLLIDGEIYNKLTLVHDSKNIINCGKNWSKRASSLCLENNEWEELFKEKENHFKVTSEILCYATNKKEKTTRQKILDKLTIALLWFHEGCRENNDLIAVVKYAATLDTLAYASGQEGIRKLITTLL